MSIFFYFSYSFCRNSPSIQLVNLDFFQIIFLFRRFEPQNSPKSQNVLFLFCFFLIFDINFSEIFPQCNLLASTSTKLIFFQSKIFNFFLYLFYFCHSIVNEKWTRVIFAELSNALDVLRGVKRLVTLRRANQWMTRWR